MSVVVTVSPTSPVVGSIALGSVTGLTDYKTRYVLDTVIVASVCHPDGGAVSGSFTVGSTVGSQTLVVEQLIAGTWTSVGSLMFTAQAAPPTTSSSPIVVSTNSVTIEDLAFHGTMPTPGPLQSLGAGVSSSGGTAASPITNLTIRRCTFSGFRLAIYLQFVNNLLIEDCTIEDADYAGIALFSCIHVVIQRNTIRRIGYVRNDFTDPAFVNNAYGIMTNRNQSASLVTDPVSEDVLIDSNVVDWVPLWMGINTHGGKDHTISNNEVSHSPRGIFCAGSPTGTGTTEAVDIDITNNLVLHSVTKTGGSTDKSAIKLLNATGTSVTGNQTGTSFTTAVATTGSTGITNSGNTTVAD